MNTKLIAAITEAIENMDSRDLIGVNNQYCQDCNIESEIFDNDEEFLNTYFKDADSAVRAVSYGEYQYSHNYVRFNGYGNLESMHTVGTSDLCELVSVIAEHIAENFSDYESYFDFGEDDFLEFEEDADGNLTIG